MAETIQHLHVVCYKWGTLYSPEYVNILAAMLGRQLSVPHQIHCITDDATGLDPAIEPHPLPDLGFEGIWRKLMTFQDNFLGLNGEYVLSIDLDVVIVDSLDFVAEQPEHDLLIARNWSRDSERGTGPRGSGSLYRLKVGSHPEIWDHFIRDPESAIDTHHGKTRMIGEQKWLDAHFPEFHFFPRGKVVSYKRHCHSKGRIIRLAGMEMLNTARFGAAETPPGAAMVSFHGDPSPAEVRDKHWGRWRRAPFVRKHWIL